ncbi:hypothetical protein [Streptomyces sp. NPDC000395]|uniref:hypothetical protein n=1 Tax=Streptomyces sp. NPDC000395 TaxID=3154252 RepID=UPI00336A5973
MDIVLPAAPTTLTWYGGGPGEAYPDTCAAARIGRFTARVEELQTPYLFPRENGSRTGVRWAELHGGPAGSSLRVSGPEPFSLAVRPWSAAALDVAGHTTDLRPDGHLYLALDAAQHGIGSASWRARRTARPSARCRTDVLRRGIARRLTVSQVGSTDGGATDSRTMRWVPSTT